MATHLKKFRPDRAVEILQSKEQASIFKTLALAELMSWMALDQKKGKRNQSQVFSRRHALLARNVVIVSLLVRQYQGKKNSAAIFELLELFLTSGGFKLFLRAPRSPKGWLSKLRKSVEMAYVHEVTSYLCRYKKYGDDSQKGSVEYAKEFVVDPRNPSVKPTTTSVKPRTVAKYWETNKQAAPYIFAFYKSLTQMVCRAKSIDEMVDLFAEQSSNQDLMSDLLGIAAHIADTLSELKVRNVRKQDFKSVARVPPQFMPFDANEKQIIVSMDIHALSAKDKKPYIPKTVIRQS